MVTKASLGLALLITLSSCAKQSASRGQNNNANSVKPEDRPLRLTQFERIHGTRYLMAEISDTLSRDSSSISSSGGNGNIRNLVFLDGESLDSHRLFDSNAYVILTTMQWPSDDKTRDSAAPIAPTVAQWLVLQVLKNDTNGDGRLDISDQRTIGVTDAGGNGYAEVLSGLDQVLGVTMLSAGQVVIVYSRGDNRSASVIDLNNRKVVSTKALIDLGQDVK